MKLDLSQLIFDKIEELGPEAAAAFFGKTPTTIAKWKGGTAIPDVGAAQKVLDLALESKTVAEEMPVVFANPPQGSTIPESIEERAEKAEAQVGGKDQTPVDLIEVAERATKYDILIPVHRLVHDAVVQSILGNWKSTLPKEVRPLLSMLHFQRDTLIHRARNLLATRFLDTKNEWSFWMDSDIIAPIGNPKWFAAQTRARYQEGVMGTESAVERLTSHKKTFVAAVYSERNGGGSVIASTGIGSKGTKDNKVQAEIGKGPSDKLVEVAWAGFGCVAVHRKVFEDILVKVPGVKSEKKDEPHGFFTAFEGGPQGEDVAFAKRALQAGHRCYLDLSVFCGHIGNFAFLPA